MPNVLVNQHRKHIVGVAVAEIDVRLRTRVVARMTRRIEATVRDVLTSASYEVWCD